MGFGAAGPRRRAAARRRPSTPRAGGIGGAVGFVFARRHEHRRVLSNVVVGRCARGLGFLFQCLVGFVRAYRPRLHPQHAQLLQAAADLAALLRLVASNSVKPLDVEGGERVRLLPCEAGLRWAELGGGVEQGDLDPLGALALPERDGEPPCQPGLDLGGGAGLLGHGRDQRLQRIGHLVLEHEMMDGGEAMLQRVARDPGLAFLRHGTFGAGAVAAGSLDLGGGAGGGHGIWSGGSWEPESSIMRMKILGIDAGSCGQSAWRRSVRLKSLPLNSSGASRWRANA